MKRFSQAGLALLAVCSLLAFTPAQLSSPPSTDIFVADLESRDGQLRFSRPVNITRRDGYDNQPAFMPDGRSLLFTSIRTGDLPDIYRYNFADQSSVQVTATAEGEFSPTPMRGGKFFSVIRVEADQTQRLWKFPISGGPPQLLLENIKPVGYHCWLGDDTVGLFVLGRPTTLQIAELRTGKAATIESNIGRCLRLTPTRDALTFVHKVSENEWFIKALDLKTRKIETITRTLAGSEDFVWTPDGVILMANGAKLFKYDPKRGHEWQEAADFTGAGLTNITRLAVSPKGNKVALVAATPSAK